jgi:hypothetical protein
VPFRRVHRELGSVSEFVPTLKESALYFGLHAVCLSVVVGIVGSQKTGAVQPLQILIDPDLICVHLPHRLRMNS